MIWLCFRILHDEILPLADENDVKYVFQKYEHWLLSEPQFRGANLKFPQYTKMAYNTQMAT